MEILTLNPDLTRPPTPETPPEDKEPTPTLDIDNPKHRARQRRHASAARKEKQAKRAQKEAAKRRKQMAGPRIIDKMDEDTTNGQAHILKAIVI